MLRPVLIWWPACKQLREGQPPQLVLNIESQPGIQSDYGEAELCDFIGKVQIGSIFVNKSSKKGKYFSIAG